MKYLLASLGVNLTSLACIVSAGYLAANDKEVWGWFLAAGLLCASAVKFRSSED